MIAICAEKSRHPFSPLRRILQVIIASDEIVILRCENWHIPDSYKNQMNVKSISLKKY
jgi:hypothetical protein